MVNKKSISLNTFYLLSIFVFTVILVIIVSIWNFYSVKNELNAEILKNSNQNVRITEVILELEISKLKKSVSEFHEVFGNIYHYSLNSISNTQFEQKFMDFYDSTISSEVDIFFIKSNDSKLVVNASSPFFDSKEIIPEILSVISSEDSVFHVVVDVDDKKINILSVSSDITDINSGRVLGKIYAGIVLNDNVRIIKEAVKRSTAESFSFVYNNTILSSDHKLSKEESEKVVKACTGENFSNLVLSENSSCYCCPISLDIKGPSLKLYQKIGSNQLSTVYSGVKKRLFSIIILISLLSLAAGQLTRRFINKHVVNLINYTKDTYSSKEIINFKPTPIDELNTIGYTMESLNRVQKEYENQLVLSASVFDSTIEGILITDLKGEIIQANPAVSSITGFNHMEIIGETPRIFKSSRHNSDFYEDMWSAVINKGYWSSEIWNRRKSGEAFPCKLSITTVRDPYGSPTHYVGIMYDITDVKMSEEKLKHLAYYDALTSLPNRHLFQERLHRLIVHSRKYEEQFGILSMDLDNFKDVNDLLGHHVGDQFLHIIGERLASVISEQDTVSRVGGDEFSIISHELKCENSVMNFVSKIQEALKNPVVLEGRELFATASIGVAVFPKDGQTYAELIKSADIAMYRAKESGKKKYIMFDQDMQKRVNRRIELEHDLRKAIQNDEIKVFYQAKVDSFTKKIIGCEALVRWEKSKGIFISPGEFIPLAEDTGMIVQIGEIVLKDVCENIKKWHADGLYIDASVNLSAKQFLKESLVKDIRDTVAHYGIDFKYINLEITENTVMNDVEKAILIMETLSKYGFKLSIDDFGTGYSSLSYIKRFPLNELKIDRSFIKDLPERLEDMAIVNTILHLAENMKLTVVAEGVETEAQYELLKNKNCHQIQGFYFSRPVAADMFYELLKKPNF